MSLIVESKNNGKVIVVYDDETRNNVVVPFFCSICSFQMKTIQDSMAYRKSSCCSKCDLYWSFKKEIDWSDREKYPDKLFKEEWAEYIKDRELRSRPILIFK